MNVLWSAVGAAVGAPLGMWFHAWLIAQRDLRAWRKILAKWAAEGDGGS